MIWKKYCYRVLPHIGMKCRVFICVVLYIIIYRMLYESWLENRIHFIPRLKVTSFMLDTAGCRIPSFDPFHPELNEYFGLDAKVITCIDKVPLTYQENVTLKLNESVRDTIPHFAYCQYEVILRVPGTDDKVKYSFPVVFNKDINVSDEFLRVNCFDKAGWNIYRNFHAFPIPKPKILNTLKQRHQKRQLKDSPRDVLNVMMIGIDSLSRFNHIVKMPKTRDFLLTNLSAIELEGYNKVADNTLVNLTPMFTGNFISEEYQRLNISERESSFVDDFNFILKNYSKMGYAVLFAEDHPVIAIYNYRAPGFKNPPTDYYFRPFTLSLDDDSSVWNNEFCILNRPETNIVLDYSSDFMQYVKDVPKFSFTFNTRLTHDSIEVLSTADLYYYNFLDRTLQSGVLNNTILIFFGDHGYRFGKIMKTDYGRIQCRLPMMYIVFPTWFSNKYPEIYQNVVTNSKRLTTPFDIYEFLKDILEFTGVPRKVCSAEKRGISLFDCIPEFRSCEDAHIPLHYCTCKYKDIEGFTIGSEIVQRVSEYLVDLINKNISPFKQCSQLKLASIISVKVSVTNYNLTVTYQDILHKSDKKWRKKDRLMFGIVIKTTPGDGMFDSTVMYKLKENELFASLDSIDRINKYGSDGDCVKSDMRPFCYCS